MSRPDRSASGIAALWLGLVGQRCMAGLARQAEGLMTDAERVKLLDAAMRSPGAVGYLAGVQRSFEDAGRLGDAVTAGVLRSLLSSSEIEVVMGIRAEWLGLRSLVQSRSDLGT